MTDESAERIRPSSTSAAARRPRRRASRAPLIAALLLLALFGAVVTWPAEVGKLVARFSDAPAPSSPSPGVALTLPAPSASSIALPPASPTTGGSETTRESERAAPNRPRAQAPALDVESRLNALEARIAALLEQPVVTPDGLAEALAQSRGAMEEAARQAGQDAARATAQSAAEEAVKTLRDPSPDLSASIAALEDRVAAVEKAAAAIGSIADLEKRMAAMERASTAFAALVDLERRTGALEKTTAPLASAGDLATRLADIERAVAPLSAMFQAASRGDALTLGLLALRDALDRGAAYGEALDGLRVAAADDEALVASLDRLKPTAPGGVPSLARLRQRLDDLARGGSAPAGKRSAAETPSQTQADTPAESRGVWSEVWQRVTSSVTIRKLDSEAQASPNGPVDRDAIFAAAQSLLAAGDLSGAVERLDDDGLRGVLADAQRAPLEAWLGDARARLNAEAGLAELSRRALALAVARAAASAAPPTGAPEAVAPGP